MTDFIFAHSCSVNTATIRGTFSIKNYIMIHNKGQSRIFFFNIRFMNIDYIPFFTEIVFLMGILKCNLCKLIIYIYRFLFTIVFNIFFICKLYLGYIFSAYILDLTCKIDFRHWIEANILFVVIAQYFKLIERENSFEFCLLQFITILIFLYNNPGIDGCQIQKQF